MSAKCKCGLDWKDHADMRTKINAEARLRVMVAPTTRRGKKIFNCDHEIGGICARHPKCIAVSGCFKYRRAKRGRVR